MTGFVPDPQLSIVMPYYRRPQQLAVTLQSICDEQPKMPFEIVIVNDDVRRPELDAVVLRAKPADLCIRITTIDTMRTRTPRGPAYTVNCGVRQACGELVVLQDSECAHVGSVVDELVRRLTLDMKSYLAMRCVAVPKRVVPRNSDDLSKYDRYPEYCGRTRPKPYWFCAAFSRDDFIDAGGIDETINELNYDDDWLAWIMAARCCKVRIIDDADCLVVHQWHETFSTPGNMVRMDRRFRELVERESTQLCPRSNRSVPEWGKLRKDACIRHRLLR